jgi:hypothetical protein
MHVVHDAFGHRHLGHPANQAAAAVADDQQAR